VTQSSRDAIRQQRVRAAVERGEAQQAAVGLRDELRASIRIRLEGIEQRAQFRLARKRRVVEGEIALDQLDERPTIFESGRANKHVASLASH